MIKEREREKIEQKEETFTNFHTSNCCRQIPRATLSTISVRCAFVHASDRYDASVVTRIFGSNDNHSIEYGAA